MLALIPRAIALNLIIGQIVALVRLPIYLDSTGTVLVAALCGPWAGALTGGLSNILQGLVGSPTMVPFAVVAALVGATAGLLCQRGALRTPLACVVAGLITGSLAAVAAAPIAARLFGGVTGGGTDLIVLLYRLLGYSVHDAALLQGFTADHLDKACTFLLVAWVMRCSPQRVLAQYPLAARALGDRGTHEEPAA